METRSRFEANEHRLSEPVPLHRARRGAGSGIVSRFGRWALGGVLLWVWLVGGCNGPLVRSGASTRQAQDQLVELLAEWYRVERKTESENIKRALEPIHVSLNDFTPRLETVELGLEAIDPEPPAELGELRADVNRLEGRFEDVAAEFTIGAYVAAEDNRLAADLRKAIESGDQSLVQELAGISARINTLERARATDKMARDSVRVENTARAKDQNALRGQIGDLRRTVEAQSTRIGDIELPGGEKRIASLEETARFVFPGALAIGLALLLNAWLAVRPTERRRVDAAVRKAEEAEASARRANDAVEALRLESPRRRRRESRASADSKE